MDTVWNEARNEYEPVPESFRLLSVEVCPDSAVEAPGGGALLLETGAEFCRDAAVALGRAADGAELSPPE